MNAMCNSFDMCGRDGLLRALRRVTGDPAAALPEDGLAQGTVFPGAWAPAFIEDLQNHRGSYDGKPEDSGPLLPVEVRPLRFGVPVDWKRDSVFNARLDSLLRQEGFWDDAIVGARCVVPCPRFFESHRSEKALSPRTGKPVKRRYGFESSDGEPLLLGAVRRGDAFAVVTTDPNPAMAPVHDRMPLVLTVDEAREWLDPSTSLDRLADLADRSSVRLRAFSEQPLYQEADQLELPL